MTSTRFSAPDADAEPDAKTENAAEPPTALPLTDAERLLQWVETHPRYAPLVKSAQSGQPLPPVPQASWLAKMKSSVVSIFIAQPQDLYGTAFVTQNVRTDARVTASVVTASNLIDAVGNWPIFLFSMGGSTPLGWVLSGLTTVLMLKINNDVSTTVARGKEGSKAWARWAAILGLLPLSVLKSFTTGIGVELLNNRSELVHLRATELANLRLTQTQAQIANSLAVNPAVQERCSSAENKLQQMPKDSPLWASSYARLYGQWADRNRDWSTVPFESLPICRQVERLEYEANQKHEAAQSQYAEYLALRTQLGNDLLFLKAAYPQSYDQTFTASAADPSEADFKSGVEAVSYALQNFTAKAGAGEWNALGLSLFFLLLSVFTSTVAIVMVLTYARRDDVQMSWDDQVRQERDRWLNQQFNQLLQKHEADLEALSFTSTQDGAEMNDLVEEAMADLESLNPSENGVNPEWN